MQRATDLGSRIPDIGFVFCQWIGDLYLCLSLHFLGSTVWQFVYLAASLPVCLPGAICQPGWRNTRLLTDTVCCFLCLSRALAVSWCLSVRVTQIIIIFLRELGFGLLNAESEGIKKVNHTKDPYFPRQVGFVSFQKWLFGSWNQYLIATLLHNIQNEWPRVLYLELKSPLWERATHRKKKFKEAREFEFQQLELTHFFVQGDPKAV